MSHILWSLYWTDNVDKFRRLLAPAGYTVQSAAKSPNVGSGAGSFGIAGTSPRATTKSRKASSYGASFGGPKYGSLGLGKHEINSRDHAGLTILLRAASSTSENAIAFVQALLDHPAIDLYVQDPESGWNALHRALYAGNVSVARLLLEKERKALTGHTVGVSMSRVGQLIKTKDHEGNSPFDLYNSTIGERDLNVLDASESSGDGSESDEASPSSHELSNVDNRQGVVPGDEVFSFGSNKNLTLGLGDEDDRQYPERVFLKRPDHLIQRFHHETAAERGNDAKVASNLDDIPTLVRNRPLQIRDVVLSKLHNAIITADPVSNLYVCGVGRGGRLGLGDENTRFSFTPVQSGLKDQKVVQVALGQSHSMAITDNGKLWTWGSNAFSQLGYALPTPARSEEDPISTTPRQVFGPLRNEFMIGVAASAIHSVAHTESSLYCWGKNIGQLALMDADSRSLEVQQIPRKVAASLFPSSIVMVSAIDKATTCLLANHMVCVFTSYGYNIVKFPFPDPFSNSQLSATSMSSRYDPGRIQISYIASGGETIAAVTNRGDLFTMSLNQKNDFSQGITSTTNPSKIKGALTQPQCIWSAHKDRIRSVDVGEHGSVIICTQSGAVWRRVKRAKAKDSYVAGSADLKRGDFKFQRVPYITNVVTVRSSVFGAFSAVRKDSAVMKEQIHIDEPTLWDDLAPLLSLRGFQASEPTSKDKDTLKFWDTAKMEARHGSVAFQVLKSPDLDADLANYLTNWGLANESLGTVICTTDSPEVRVPVHSWMLSARSPVLRQAFANFRNDGTYELAEVFSIGMEDGQTMFTLQGVDLMTLLNLVLYIYEDRVIPAWNYTRQAPPLAYRYRQIRSELMKLSTRLNMIKLEAAVRMQVDPKRCMDEDFKLATKSRSFFEDGDALLELDGTEVPVHSAFLCQRCPWFKGLFQGRSGGLWLASRRETLTPSEKVKIDLKHMDPDGFRYVLQHLYADVDEELFDQVTSANTEDFIDLVMEVMSIANELMLDRLSQICQKVMGRFVNTRNIAHLLNAVSPCSVAEFKDAGLEYICLQMESMLENHLLDDLEEDLLLELGDVVRDNQLTRLPISKSGRAELELLEKHPALAEDIDEERQRRVREMAYKAMQREDERKLSSSFKGRLGSLDDSTPVSPSPQKHRKVSKAGQNEPFSPDLRPKASQADLMFDMDDDDASQLSTPLGTSYKTAKAAQTPGSARGASLLEAGRKPIQEHHGLPVGSPATPPAVQASLTPYSEHTMSKGRPWGPSGLPTAKLDLREIMTEATSTQSSALSAGLAAQKAKDAAPKVVPNKMSQKERKKQQQMQAAQASQEATSPQSQAPWETPKSGNRASPWKLPQSQSTPSDVKGSLLEVPKSAVPPITKSLVATEGPAKSIPRRTASPDTRFSGQSRTPSTPIVPSSSRPSAKSSASAPLVPHSKRYIKPASKAEPSFGLSMADIIGQQKREQQIVQEAVAKRSLQEIQQEQEFQEWWDQESLRTQEEEARKVGRDKEKEEGKGRGRSGRGGKSRGSTSGTGRRGGSGNAGTSGGARGKGRGGGGGVASS